MAEGLGGAIEAGKAFVEFLLDDKKFTGALGAIGRKLSKVGKVGVLATAPLIAALSACTYEGIALGAELTDMASDTGIAAAQLSRLSFVADQFNVSMEDVEHSIRKMQQQLADTTPAGDEFRKMVRLIGVDIESLRQQTPDQQFIALAAAIGGVVDPSQRAYIAQKIFGKQGIETLRILKKGVPAFLEAAAASDRLGATISNQEVEALDDLGTAFGESKKQLQGLMAHVAAAISGPLIELVHVGQEIVTVFNEFVTEHPYVVAAFAVIGTTVFAVSSALVALGTAVRLYTVLTEGATAITYAFNFSLALLEANPLIASIIAITAAVAGLVYWFSAGSSSATDFNSKMGGLKSPRVAGSGFSPRVAPGAVSAFGSPVGSSQPQNSGEKSLAQLVEIESAQLRFMRYGNQGFQAGVG